MNRIRTVIGILLVWTLPAAAQYRTSYADLEDSETMTVLKEHVAYLASPTLEGRAPGSEGEKDAAIYLTDVLKSYGVDILSAEEGDVFGLRMESGDTLTSRNVVGFIPGYDASLRDHYILIGARMDNIGTAPLIVDGERQESVFYGANGNASGMALLLELARMLSARAVLLRRSVLIVGFGASTQGLAGSWYFLNRSFPDADRIDAMVNLDMLGSDADGLQAYTASNADLNALLASVSASLQPVRPAVTAAEPFPSDHRAFYDRKIPAVYFSTGKYPEWNSPRDVPATLDYEGMERELEYLYNFSIALSNGPKPIFNPGELTRDRDEVPVVPFYDCDVKPVFLGSNDPKTFLEKWVYQYLRYPPEAVRKGAQGNVLVDFIIDERGKVTDVRVLRGVDELLDAEAVRVISASPSWKPGTLSGRKVRAEISLYVEFRLERNK